VRAEARPGIRSALPAEGAAEDVRIRREGQHLGGETHGEPRRVRLLDRLAHLGEAGGAGDEEADPQDEQDRGYDPTTARLPEGTTKPVDRSSLTLDAFAARHCQELRRATEPSAAPATASST
jgi:hypothetical protein